MVDRYTAGSDIFTPPSGGPSDDDADRYEEGEGDEEGAEVSAAASGEPVPPMAVALVSSFYTSEPHPIDKLRENAGGTHVSTQVNPPPSGVNANKVNLEPVQAVAAAASGADAEMRPSSLSLPLDLKAMHMHMGCEGDGCRTTRPSLDSHLLLNSGASAAFPAVPEEDDAEWPAAATEGGGAAGTDGAIGLPPFNEDEYAGGWHRPPRCEVRSEFPEISSK